MRRILGTAGVVLALVGFSSGTAVAQQQREVTPVTLRESEEAGAWLMDIGESDGTLAIWSIHVGTGCENIQDGPAALLVDGIGVQWLVLSDATPGTCHIDEADLVQVDQG
jgi:hypothetical protein